MARDQCQTGFKNFLDKHKKNISTLHKPMARDQWGLNVELSKMVYINYLLLLKVFHLASYLAPEKPKKKLEINPFIFHQDKIYVFTWSLLHLFVTPFY